MLGWNIQPLQDELEYWKVRAARLSLLVEQVEIRIFFIAGQIFKASF